MKKKKITQALLACLYILPFLVDDARRPHAYPHGRLFHLNASPASDSRLTAKSLAPGEKNNTDRQTINQTIHQLPGARRLKHAAPPTILDRQPLKH